MNKRNKLVIIFTYIFFIYLHIYLRYTNSIILKIYDIADMIRNIELVLYRIGFFIFTRYIFLRGEED